MALIISPQTLNYPKPHDRFDLRFADLVAAQVFESLLGNAKATQAVTQLTALIGVVCTRHHGAVVKPWRWRVDVLSKTPKH
jgi:hypothetical protein